MKRFYRIEEQIRQIFESFMKEFDFSLEIFENEIKLINKRCKVLIIADLYYPTTKTTIFNPGTNLQNNYELGEIMRLRKIPFIKGKLDSEKDSDDACCTENLEITAKILKLCCADVLNGNFKKLDDEGYWKLPELTQKDIEFVVKYGKYPD